MAADGDCHHLCKLMAPVRHRWSISDSIGEIRNTVMPSDCSALRFGIRSKASRRLLMFAITFTVIAGAIATISSRIAVFSSSSVCDRCLQTYAFKWSQRKKSQGARSYRSLGQSQCNRISSSLVVGAGGSCRGVSPVLFSCLCVLVWWLGLVVVVEEFLHVIYICYCCSQLPIGRSTQNKTHNIIRSMIADALRYKNLDVHKEVHCIAGGGSNRRIDIIAINRNKQTAEIIDPTIRFEISATQPSEVNEEKKKIYEPTIQYLSAKCNIVKITVTGLFFVARGTIPKAFVNWRGKDKLTRDLQDAIVTTIIQFSVVIFRQHLYDVHSI
ncbi:hypothetical protein ANN_10617 [Periplaneta americana]|uniref:Uncharacterized protein n=1 Tax=Periplaneta americana TaxID=6978 RepID=A0ABQ8TQL1_PERAM|nr:hypothetical protein ANN_10617 [Periplaneta americana]